MEYVIDIMREYPALVLFLTVGAGFFIGRLKFKGFALGSVTAVLLVGVLVGQIGITLSDQLKSVFFMLFLFSIGYSVGPKFFRSLRGLGLRQALFAVLMSLCCFGATLLMATIMHYSVGETVGLFSGSQTCSSLLGVGGDAIGRLPLSKEQIQQQVNIMPVCYAVTYIFGTLGTVILLGNFGPRILGGIDNVKKQTRNLEEMMDRKEWENDPSFIKAARGTAYRIYKVQNEFFATSPTVKEAEAYFRSNGQPLFIDRIRSGNATFTARPSRRINIGDSIVLGGRREMMMDCGTTIGPEIHDSELLDYPIGRLSVMLAKKHVRDIRLAKLMDKPFMHGVLVAEITRFGKKVEISDTEILRRGDRLVLLGQPANINKAAARMGVTERPTNSTDLMFVGLALFIGGFIGALTFMVDSIPLSFGTSGGALIAGLVFGWLRSRHPSFGQIPDAALWLMNNLGLNAFIAVVGINAAPSFISGLVSVGPMLLLVGAVCTTIPLLLGLWLGHKVFKFAPAITLGCCAGTRTCTAALGAVQESLGSTLPAMGYTVTYAVSNILLVIWGLASVLIVGA